MLGNANHLRSTLLFSDLNLLKRGAEEESHISFGQLTAEFEANGLVIEVVPTPYWFKLSWVTMIWPKNKYISNDNHFSQSVTQLLNLSFNNMAQPVIESYIQQPLFRTYFFYVSLLCIKMLLMSILTAMKRFTYKV